MWITYLFPSASVEKPVDSVENLYSISLLGYPSLMSAVENFEKSLSRAFCKKSNIRRFIQMHKNQVFFTTIRAKRVVVQWHHTHARILQACLPRRRAQVLGEGAPRNVKRHPTRKVLQHIHSPS